MILTTGEIGLFAVAATITGVIATQRFERKRYKTTRQERWFTDRKDAYIDFYDTSIKIDPVCQRIYTLCDTGNIDKIADIKTDNYTERAETANKALAAVGFIGSNESRLAAQNMADAQQRILSLHPNINKGPVDSRNTSPSDVKELYEKYRTARKAFVNIAREELGANGQQTNLNGSLPDTGLVLATRWIRKKFYLSYLRNQ
ncbi:MAG: hypothetical protein JWP85_2808 [Rhodoglobus sp.]|nr:hypothetical protein [Rhodoglobus sp.]